MHKKAQRQKVKSGQSKASQRYRWLCPHNCFNQVQRVIRAKCVITNMERSICSKGQLWDSSWEWKIKIKKLLCIPFWIGHSGVREKESTREHKWDLQKFKGRSRVTLDSNCSQVLVWIKCISLHSLYIPSAHLIGKKKKYRKNKKKEKRKRNKVERELKWERRRQRIQNQFLSLCSLF